MTGVSTHQLLTLRSTFRHQVRRTQEWRLSAASSLQRKVRVLWLRQSSIDIHDTPLGLANPIVNHEQMSAQSSSVHSKSVHDSESTSVHSAPKPSVPPPIRRSTRLRDKTPSYKNVAPTTRTRRQTKAKGRAGQESRDTSAVSGAYISETCMGYHSNICSPADNFAAEEDWGNAPIIETRDSAQGGDLVVEGSTAAPNIGLAGEEDWIDHANTSVPSPVDSATEAVLSPAAPSGLADEEDWADQRITVPLVESLAMAEDWPIERLTARPGLADQEDWPADHTPYVVATSGPLSDGQRRPARQHSSRRGPAHAPQQETSDYTQIENELVRLVLQDKNTPLY